MSTATAANPWQMKASSGGGGGGEVFVCPPGNHIGQLTGLIHAGNVTNNFGETANTIILVYQLAKKREDGKPYVLAEKYTFSLNTKANFRKVVESITGKTLQDGEEFDPRDIVGRTILVTVKNTPSKDGKRVYDAVGGVGQLPEGFPEPSAEQFPHEPFVFSVMDGEPFPMERAAWLPYCYGQPIHSIVEGSQEVRARQTKDIPPPPGRPGSAYQAPTDDEDIPY